MVSGTTKPRLETLQWYHRLPSTADLQQQISLKGLSKHLASRLEACLERDAIVATRPPGCGCLGAGIALEGAPNYCLCTEGLSAQEAAKAKDVEAEQERLALRWQEADIPLRFRDYRLSGAPASLRGQVAILEAAASREESLSWFLWGHVGRGKTGLAVAYAYEALVNRQTGAVKFISAPDLFSRLRATYGRPDSNADAVTDHPSETEWDIISACAEAPLLILDDLGAEAVSTRGQDWLQDRLYQVIGTRHAEERPTIFTSNMDLQGLVKKCGERVTWRILEMVGQDHLLHLDGPNLRDGTQ